MVLGTAFNRGATPPSDECLRQIECILQSGTFRNATTLQQLLQFLATRALDGSTGPLKEYTIGVEAFRRPQNFDPKIDTIVRVQIHRLRQKLKEYYDADGSHDPILVEIPKGHYLPTFEIVPSLNHDEDQTPKHNVPRNTRAYWITACIVTAVLGVFAAGFYGGVKRQSGRVVDTTRYSAQDYMSHSDPAKAFWATFVGDDPTPVIAIPDAEFLLDNSSDLFTFRHGAIDDRGSIVDPHLAQQIAANPTLVAKAGTLYYENGYTGAGEAQGIAALANLFGQMGIRPLVKPSRDVTPGDLSQHNVILLGSWFQNVAVAHLMTQGDFSFRISDSCGVWCGEVVNARPEGQEGATYHTERDPATRVLKADYGIISIQNGVVAGRHIAVLGGLDTTGTAGTILFATSKDGVEEMQKALGWSLSPSASGDMPQFQAVVRVRLEKGYQVLGSSLISVHRIAPPNGRNSENSSLPTPTK